MHETRGHVVGRDSAILGAFTLSVRSADHLTALHAATGHEAKHRPRVMVTAHALVDLGRAPKFTCDKHGGAVQQTFFLQRPEEAAQSGIERG